MAKTQLASKAPRTKAEIIRAIAEETNLTQKEIASVFEALAKLIRQDLGRRGPKKFIVPGLVKITVVRKPATRAQRGINPFTGEEIVFKAKPARNIVRVSPLKELTSLLPGDPTTGLPDDPKKPRP